MAIIKRDQIVAPAENPDEILSGGPAESVDEVQGEPEEYVKVKIDGVEYTVTKEVAAAMEERERGFQRKLTEQAVEITSRYKQPQQVSNAQPVEDNLDVLLFENPKEALKKLEDRIITRVATAYNAEQGVRDFWGAFYQENEDLKRYDRIAKVLLNEHFNEWANLPSATARQRLAQAVRDEVLNIVEGHTGTRPQRSRTFVESSNSGTRPAPRQPAPAKPKTLSEVIHARRAAHAAPVTRK